MESRAMSSTDTILRKLDDFSDSQLAPLQGINAEGLVIVAEATAEAGTSMSQGTETRGNAKYQRRPVPEHLLPGNNAGQMNWAEQQLADAQQTNRPLSDLPGFAANYLTGKTGVEEEEEEEEEYEQKANWNPIPWINPEVRAKEKRGRKILKSAADSIPTPAPAAAPVAPAKSDEELMRDVLGVLFIDDQKVMEAQTAGSNGKNSYELVQAQGSLLGAKIDDVVAVDPDARALTFVDEHACIGCYNCAMIARNTFLMEDLHGRARVFQQQGDSDEVIEEAILSCPVDCIHAVSLPELKQLEQERETDVINNKSRLVGGSYTAEEKGGTPWLRLLARRAAEGKGMGLNWMGF